MLKEILTVFDLYVLVEPKSVTIPYFVYQLPISIKKDIIVNQLPIGIG